MKKVRIKVQNKKILKDCSWLMDDRFNFIDRNSLHNYHLKEVEIIKDNLSLAVYSNGNYHEIHDLQIKIIETGEKFYTRSRFISNEVTEKILFVSKSCERNAGICLDKLRFNCDGISCKDCFYQAQNHKAWYESL